MSFDGSTCRDLNSSSAVLSRLIGLFENDRLPHAVFLLAEDVRIADKVAYPLSGKILKCDDCAQHLDFFQISPNDSGGAQITADMIRDLIVKIQMSPKLGRKKVAYVRFADRMNKFAANSFLKTLEEPPADTMILLSADSQYTILPTILSRCVTFRISDHQELSSPILENIANMYEAWLGKVHECSKIDLSIIEMYKLLAYVEQHLDELAEERTDVERVILKILEISTAKIFKIFPKILPKLHSVIEVFEHSRYFFSINCNIVANLERCFILIVKFFEKEQSQ